MLSVSVLTMIGVIGLGFFLITLVFDGIFDFADGEPVIPAFAFYAAMFGFSGALAANMSDEGETMFVVPALIALVATAIFYFVYRSFRKHADADENYAPDPQAMVGKLVKVNWWNPSTVKGKPSNGEVMVTWAGQPRRVRAASDENFTSTSTAYVVEVHDENNVTISSVNPLTNPTL